MYSGVTSDNFHSLGNTPVSREEFIMCVRGAQDNWQTVSNDIRINILSGPGDLFFGIAIIIRWTSVQVTGLKLNCCSNG
jgi:hypothetical protein